MPRQIEEPTIVNLRGTADKVETQTHPAYAQISIHHVSGSVDLYGSDFTHHNFVTISIRRSQLHRELARDWHFEKEELIQVALSEAQYATMVSSPNRAGVPCTIQHLMNEQVPGLPRRDSTKLHNEEFRAKLEKTLQALRVQREEMISATGSLPKKTRDRLLYPIDAAIREIASNIPFFVESFSEHMETNIERAKVEVEAYVTNTIHRAGLDALQTAGSPALTYNPEKK